MSGSLLRMLRFGCGAGCLAALAIPATFAAGTKQDRAADTLVKEALHAEIYGLSQDRERYLEEARQTSPNYAPAHWHAGQAQYKNQWVKPEETPARVSSDGALHEYRKIRENYPNTAEGQLTLANWCQKKGLPDQERAHLTRVIDIQPDHGEARRRLGFHRIEGVWMSEQEIKLAQERGAAAAKALGEWQPKLEAIRDALNPQRPAAQRQTALARLQAITDPASVPALELVFSNADRDTALLLVETLDRISDDQAALALARQALFSSHEVVRMTAARNLKSKPIEAFVPALLSAMYTPVQSRTEIYSGPGGRLMYRHSFLREGKDNKDLVVLETAFRRDALPNGDGRDTLSRMLVGAGQMQAQRDQQAMLQNAQADALNQRICGLLALTQESNVAPRPETWWKWWNDTNEVYVSGEKPIREAYQLQQIKVEDRVSLPSGGPSISTTPMPPSMDCFRAGTLVWTLHGPQAIEKTSVGDLVLSQDVETGEVAYKPVLRTTVRPREKLIRATIGSENFEMSGGHLLWVAGDGWTKARKLKSGAELHALGGSVPAVTIEEGSSAETYNLIVADFNTYFVGQAKLLSHDNTIKRRTSAIVPGLVEGK